jgi:hypothetical protein
MWIWMWHFMFWVTAAMVWMSYFSSLNVYPSDSVNIWICMCVTFRISIVC